MVLVFTALVAGCLTTVAGMGGGLLLLLAVGLWLDDPLGALVVTSPALLVGNLHRAWSLRRDVVAPVFVPLVLSSVPASFLVARWVVDAPVDWLRWALFGVAVLACLRGVGLWSWVPSERWAVPVGLVAGAIQSTAGGSGVVLAPYLMGGGT